MSLPATRRWASGLGASVARQLITAGELSRLVEEGAQLVDVLGADEYEQDHIAGATNIPLKQLTASTAARLDRSRPVIVYCNDFG